MLSRKNGFSLIELIITLAIIAILVGVSFPLYTKHIVKIRRTNATLALSEDEIVKAIIGEKQGACHHRAIAFKKLASCFDIHARIVVNDCHAYVEVFLEDY
ncbi:unnamed protein product [marine sediment metagenome]|uniref:Prepilin-type N-terminal cleavage/methylation domain-containing protein n=1 Tax=marine sediment metagenome TaxID=412755 RepID=X0ZEG1_9ZZZZ